MSMSDPIADMLTRIRNAILRKHKSVSIPCSKVKEKLAEVLLREGFILGFSKEEKEIKGNLTIDLKYDFKGEPLVRSIKRISRPGLRIHKGYQEMKPLLNGQGVYIISTSKGLLTDMECRNQQVGGEVLCSVY